jgi:hypothetical protein
MGNQRFQNGHLTGSIFSYSTITHPTRSALIFICNNNPFYYLTTTLKGSTINSPRCNRGIKRGITIDGSGDLKG